MPKEQLNCCSNVEGKHVYGDNNVKYPFAASHPISIPGMYLKSCDMKNLEALFVKYMNANGNFTNDLLMKK